MTKRDILEYIGYIIGCIIICTMFIDLLYSGQDINLFFTILIWATILASTFIIGVIVTSMLDCYLQEKYK